MTEEQLKELEAKRNRMKEAAMPLIMFLREESNPHAVAHVDQIGVTLYSADMHMPVEWPKEVFIGEGEGEKFTMGDTTFIPASPYYFTFGSNHCDANGRSLGDSYLKVMATSESEARDMVCKVRGRKWAFSYPEEHWGDQAERYDLKMVGLEGVKLPAVEVEQSMKGK